MKNLFGIVMFSLCASINAQEMSHLTLEDAVLSAYKGLNPEQKSIQLIDGSDDFALIENDGLYILPSDLPDLVSKVPLFTLVDLQASVPSIKRMPHSFHEINSSMVYFDVDTSMIAYSYINHKIKEEISFPKEAENRDFDSKAAAMAYTMENNLYLATPENSMIPVTQNRDMNIVSGQAIARSEFGIRKGTFWSSNGSRLAFYEKDESQVTNYPLVNYLTTPATLENIKYPMNGMNSEIAKVGIYDLENRELIYLDIDTSDEHYLTNLTWTPDEKHILLAEVNRDQNQMWLNVYDAGSGKKVRTLFEERNSRWVEPEHDAVFIPGSNSEFLWMSERSGFMNIYVYDIQKGFVNRLTNFPWVVKSILGFDENAKHVIITGTGNDPRETKAFKVNLKSGKATELTSEPGSHKVMLSPNGKYLIDQYSSLDVPGITKLKDVHKNREKVVFESENPFKNYHLGTTELITLEALDGSPLYGRIIKPANFDASRKYPALIYVYGGPHVQLVTNSWLGGSRLWMQWLAAEKDYVVFTLDNRGSSSRGFEFESVIHRQLGEKEMEDQMTGVSYLKSLPYVDENRLAVHGWSYGGFMTNSLMLRHPGVFTTAVAGGPVTDWKWYEIMYGERYMDRWQDNEMGFERSRIHNYVQNLDGKLMQIIGSVDPVVVPQHTMTLLKAFVDSKKQVDFLSYPMHPHNVRGIDRVHLMQKVLDYIIENNK
jgi:dipeptidyl-peptidase-4